LTVAPLQIARGTQNKILESMAMGVPVVCSDRAAAGVDVVVGEHLLTARDPADWAVAVERLLASAAEREAFANAARARVLSHHAWASSMRRVDGIIARLIKSKARGVAA
jgi:glycosyltransferase involved in cell wall biosynthesis